jgi:gas vesicle protein
MEKRHSSSEEIDLLYFFNPLIKGTKNYLHRLRQNIVLFFIIFFICIAVGYSLRFFLPKYFKTNAIFVSYLPADFSAAMINDLQTLIENSKNTSVLAGQLKISPASAGSIKSISTEIMDSLSYMNKRDTTSSAFKIYLTVSDAASIPIIQEGLRNFLENNEYSLKRKQAKRQTLEAMRSDFIEKIKGLDSLKNILNTTIVPRSTGQGVILGEPISPIDAYEMMQKFYKDQKEIEEQLMLLQNIEVLQPFLQIKASNYPDYNKLFFYSILIGLVLGLIIAPLTAKPY